MRLASRAALLAFLLIAAPAAAQTSWSAAGEIQDGDAAEGDRRYDDHPIRLEGGVRYRIAVDSEAFDPLARLYRVGEAQAVAENDDGDEGLNPRISYSPAQSGDYILRVLSFSPDGRGAYSATVEVLPPLPPPSTAFSRMELTVWRVYSGELTPSDPQEGGRHFDDYLVGFTAGQQRTIALESAAFDALVQVFPAANRVGEPLAQDDDSGGGRNSMLLFEAHDSGDYVVRVTSYNSGTGGYTLRVSE